MCKFPPTQKVPIHLLHRQPAALKDGIPQVLEDPVDLVRVGHGDKAKAPRFLGAGIAHDAGF
jgi:hypothetical protein